MPNVRKIGRDPTGKNYFLVDANFLANKHIPPATSPDARQRERIESCVAWWDEIEDQLSRDVRGLLHYEPQRKHVGRIRPHVSRWKSGSRP